jgi:GntR family transcriptional regulator
LAALVSDLYTPRYRTIEQALRERIAVRRPGDPLPSDAELCAEFRVSRMTARNAMQRLVDEGLVVRDPGRGTFVADPPSHRRANSLLSFTEEMRRRGRAASSRVVRRDEAPATEAEALALRTAVREVVTHLVRIRFADDEPIALERSTLSGEAGRVALAADVESGSLHAALADAGFQLVRGHATITAEAATSEDASLLSMREGDPLLVERRVIVDQHGTPVEATESRYPAQRYALDVAFYVGDGRPSRLARR